MPDTLSALTLDLKTCERARQSRDARFDGLFFIAVRSTGIYCRPVCPAPTAKRENVRFFATAAAAEGAGFRPCLRCRPELAPGNDAWRRGDHVVTRALKLIEGGWLQEHSINELARYVGVGARQLRRLFVERLGAPPIDVHTTRRLLFAKQLLTETHMPVTDVALAAGFGSLRRFNAAFAQANRIQPRELRRTPHADMGDGLCLRLSYRPPYDFVSMLAFLRSRALPGIEVVDDRSYMRVFSTTATTPGWLRLSAWPGEQHALRLELHGAPPAQMLDVVNRIRRMFDLDADPRAIANVLLATPQLQAHVRKHPGVRLPGAWDGFEVAVRAILGQQVSVAAARTLASRIVHRYGAPLPTAVAPGLECLFPTPESLVDADLRALGVTTARTETIRGVARAILDGRVDFRVEQSLDEFVQRWVALTGIGEWTANYMAMRALSHPDAFPAADLILRRAASSGGELLSTKALTQLAEAWRPWRAYAVMHFWRSTSEASSVTFPEGAAA